MRREVQTMFRRDGLNSYREEFAENDAEGRLSCSVENAHPSSDDDPPAFRFVHSEDGPGGVRHFHLDGVGSIGHPAILFFRMSCLPLPPLGYRQPCLFLEWLI